VAILVTLPNLIGDMGAGKEPEDTKTLVGNPEKQLELTQPLQVAKHQLEQVVLQLLQIHMANKVKQVQGVNPLQHQVFLAELAKAAGMVEQKVQVKQKLVNALKIAGLLERKKEKNDAHADELKVNILLGEIIKLDA